MLFLHVKPEPVAIILSHETNSRHTENEGTEGMKVLGDITENMNLP